MSIETFTMWLESQKRKHIRPANFLDSRLPERFWDKVIPEPNSGCWLWGRSIDRDGYGHFTFDGRKRLAHRHAYEQLVTTIPQGLQIDHLCRTRCCVNPSHLQVVTLQENNARRSPELLRTAFRRNGEKRRAQTHCRRGHEFAGHNLMIDTRGDRACRACSYASRGRT